MSTKELVGWIFLAIGSLCGITAAFKIGGINAAIGAVGASFTTAAAVLGISNKTTPPKGP